MDTRLISDKLSGNADAFKAIGLTALSGALAFATNLELLQKLSKQLDDAKIPSMLVWGTIIGVLVLGAAYHLLLALAQRSRLLQPERFRLNPADPTHLKGRTDDIEKLMGLCEKKALVFLDGESGCGKSALLAAGLIPYANSERTRPLILHCDLSGAPWHIGLAALVAQALHRALTEQQIKDLGWQAAPNADTVFAKLKQVQELFGRKPLLAFDQFDDYQDSHRAYFYREGSSELRTLADFLADNPFWSTIAQGVQDESWHVLFMTRNDQRSGLELVRFVEPGSYSLMRVAGNSISPVLDEIVAAGKDGLPVISNPDKGWHLLREKLLDDLKDKDSNDVLPIQLAVALRGLQVLPSRTLTLAEYAKVGGLAGLACLQIRREIDRTARACHLQAQHVLAALAALTDAERGKTRRLAQDKLVAHLLGVDDAGTRPATERQRAYEALMLLKESQILRSGVDVTASDEHNADWLLYHDHLVRAIVAALRENDRWHIELKDHARHFRLAAGWRQHWKALLPIGLQARLLWERWRPRLSRNSKKSGFVYGEQRSYAQLSLIKPMLAGGLVTLALISGYVSNENRLDQLAADTLMTTLTNATTEVTQDELNALLAVEGRGAAAASIALASAFKIVSDPANSATERAAIKINKVFGPLAHIVLGFDSSGKAAEQLLERFEVISTLEKATDQQLKLLMQLLPMRPKSDAVAIKVASIAINRMKEKNLTYSNFGALIPQINDEVLLEEWAEAELMASLNKGWHNSMNLNRIVEKINTQKLLKKLFEKMVISFGKGTNFTDLLDTAFLVMVKITDKSSLYEMSDSIIKFVNQSDKVAAWSILRKIPKNAAEKELRMVLIKRISHKDISFKVEPSSSAEIDFLRYELLSSDDKLKFKNKVERLLAQLPEDIKSKKIASEDFMLSEYLRLGEMLSIIEDEAFAKKGLGVILALLDKNETGRSSILLLHIAIKSFFFAPGRNITDQEAAQKILKFMVKNYGFKGFPPRNFYYEGDFDQYAIQLINGVSDINFLKGIFSSLSATLQTDKNDFGGNYGVKRICFYLAIISKKINDIKLLENTIATLYAKMRNEPFQKKALLEFEPSIALLAEQLPPNERELKITNILIRVSQLSPTDSVLNFYPAHALSFAKVDVLVSTLRSTFGAPGPNRDILIQALGIKLGIKDATYWNIIKTIEEKYPQLLKGG